MTCFNPKSALLKLFFLCIQPGEITRIIWSPAMKHTLHQSNKTCVAEKHHTVNYTMINREGKHSESATHISND